MTPNDKPLPCPFCGSEKLISHRQPSTVYEGMGAAWIRCDSCHCQLFAPEYDKLVVQWNTRALSSKASTIDVEACAKDIYENVIMGECGGEDDATTAFIAEIKVAIARHLKPASESAWISVEKRLRSALNSAAEALSNSGRDLEASSCYAALRETEREQIDEKHIADNLEYALTGAGYCNPRDKDEERAIRQIIQTELIKFTRKEG
jgi:transcription elongation factor Elf1